MSRMENKLRFYGLLAEARVRGEKMDYQAMADYLEEPLARLKRWANEWEEEQNEGNLVDGLLNIDDIVIERITDEVAAQIKPLFHINPITGEIEKVPDENSPAVIKERKLDETLKGFRDNVGGLQLLNSELQAAAGTLVGRVLELAQEPELNARDLGTLAGALTSIQNAFFNKPTTNIQVNSITPADGSTTLLDVFKGRLKS